MSPIKLKHIVSLSKIEVMMAQTPTPPPLKNVLAENNTHIYETPKGLKATNDGKEQHRISKNQVAYV